MQEYWGLALCGLNVFFFYFSLLFGLRMARRGRNLIPPTVSQRHIQSVLKGIYRSIYRNGLPPSQPQVSVWVMGKSLKTGSPTPNRPCRWWFAMQQTASLNCRLSCGVLVVSLISNGKGKELNPITPSMVRSKNHRRCICPGCGG